MRHREIAGKHGVICQSLNDSEAPKRLVKESQEWQALS
jgi:hypothetical protein